ncbi:MAG: T9SS type A sorting domain-containing protein [Calditrichaeota bacterium]|nr:T9SS type A sorting domain-containing protein [Calditrichota bacterium]
MKRKLLVGLVFSSFLFASLAVAAVSTQKAAPVNKAKQELSKIKRTTLPRSSIFSDTKATQNPVIWSDDFEGSQANWVTDASWNHVDTPNGRAFQDSSAWELTEENANSPTHSWHAKLGLDEELDFVISPVIYLPTEVEVEGITSPLKGLKLGYMLDVDTPEGNNSWAHLVGSAECWWHFTSDNPGAGNSSWYMEPVDIPHWRQWLTTPEIDLTGSGSTVTLSFMHKYDSEPEFDYYSVDVSTDNFVSYTNLAFYDGSNPQLDWTNVTLDLSAWAGQKIKIRFSSKGDYGTAQGFWAIDEIKVSDGTTDFFYDDGGEDGTSSMVKAGFVPGSNFAAFTADGASQPNPNWQEVTVDVPGVGAGMAIEPGDSVRIAIQWISDGTATTGRGLYIDDVNLYAVGTLPYDVAVVGVKDFYEEAIVGHTVAPVVLIQNIGLQSITGTIRWVGDIYKIEGGDTIKVWPAMFGSVNVTDFARDSVLAIPVNPNRAWPVEEPGTYLLMGKVSPPTDGDLTNNGIDMVVPVFGPPLEEVLWRCDFEPRAGQTSLEDFGFTVVNGGGNDMTGLNNNKWEYLPFVFGDGSALISWAWGDVDLGPDVTAPFDSSEVLDEYLITPPIDISKLEREATLYMQYWVYFRPSHPAVGPPFGVQWSDFDVDWSIDGGQTWHRAFHWEDHDSTTSSLTRLPHWYYGPDDPRSPLNWLTHLNVDLTPAVRMGGENIQIRFHLWSENSYFIGCDVDNIVVYSGLGHPMIKMVEDIPNDNGKQVAVCWRSSFSELQTIWTKNMAGEFEQHIITHYNVWRNSVPGSVSPTNAIKVPDMKTMLASAREPGQQFILDGTVWEFIMQVPAHHDPGYCVAAPTLWDGVPAAFMVSAHTSDPMIFVNSNIVEGTSEDNLAPHAPMSVMAAQQDFTVQLAWEPSVDEEDGAQDVQYYSIYRRTENGSYGEPIAKVAEHEFVDTSVDTGVVYYYAVTATDFAGNESEMSPETSLLVSSVAEAKGSIPTQFSLGQNYPNPFNPTTTISYALPKAAHVTLAVYNAAGQKVATLVDSDMPAGQYTATWDARDMASGVYFYKIQAGQYSATRKMVLMR